MKDSEFIFDYVHLLSYKCHKKPNSWWIIYTFSLLDKKATINPSNKKDNN